MHHLRMSLPQFAACVLVTVSLSGSSLAQTVRPGAEQPSPVVTPPTVPLRVEPVIPALRGVTLNQSIRTNALTMVGGALSTTTVAPRNTRTTNLVMIGGAIAAPTSVAPRNIRTTALTMRGTP